MAGREIYTWIMKFLGRQARKGELTTLHVIFGFAQLVSIEEKMRAVLFPDQDTAAEIEAVRSVFSRNRIDIDILKRGLRLILSFQLKESYVHYTKIDFESDTSPSEYLSSLLDAERPVIDIFVTGCSYEDVMKLKDDMIVPPERSEKKYVGFEKDDEDPTQRAEISEAQKPTVSFDDVIGAKKAKEELKYYADILKNPGSHRYGPLLPVNGILLYGAPGTGKTLLAKAMAAEADAAFFALNATDFMNKYVGEGEDRIRRLFRKARENAPAIIFIDEIDAIAKERTGEGHVETYLNTILTEMNGFNDNPGKQVFVLAATNFALERETAGIRSVIDSALIRRFDNRIRVDLPNKEERVAYMHMIMNRYKIDTVSEHAMESIAERTEGQSLAILQNIIHLAMRNADRDSILLQDSILLDTLDEYRYGEKKNWNESEYRSTAYHEAGHAYIAYLSGHTPAFVTIISRGDYAGYMQPSEVDSPNRSRDDLIWEIRTCLAGRVSEIVFTGEERGINTGAREDLRRASALALNMVSCYGMSEKSLLCLDIASVSGTPYAENMIKEAEQIYAKEMAVTKTLIEEGRYKIERLTKALLDRGQLTKEQIASCLAEEDRSHSFDEASSCPIV